MLTDVMIEDRRWRALDLEALAECAARAALEHLALEPGRFEISVLACNDARIAALNEDFRGKPQPTNVLSWPSDERGAPKAGGAPNLPRPGIESELGDIAIAYDTCAREAGLSGKPLADHATHLIVHAVLHLLGYDHVRDEDATLMEACEVAILGKLGIADPY
ncbi:rRNA maturation RNase YbeY [Pelagivirga sediminicola]|uniref:Endoribonuclease YbeY n=1 Tax=Pelagivirga sediminicola TaxID=2170575 RepID=A0A2T7G480_9RHOB|nr:rRNA maturation RNase YbeY [Pelagivirga sediminicola]PVA09190.1 rRNA maturation RNase YbeY [Pelagivirga sediminicola]